MELDSKIIAREREKEQLLKLYARNSSELVSLTGRRRVGKTFLVNALFGTKLDFELTGLQHGTRPAQLANFSRALARKTGVASKPTNWQEAFFLLEDHLRRLEVNRKMVVFFDELPWIATPKSGFLAAFGHFWNTYAERQNILIIICGSAASWMINKVVRHKGGLHNRITQRIQLDPFNLRETRAYLEAQNFNYGNYDIAELYMALGGVPYYLNALNPDLSPAQNLANVAFDRAGLLHDEFSRLYPALFDGAERHIEVIRALSARPYGLDRPAIVAATSLSNGGGLTRILEELEFSGFIQGFYLFKQKKRYRRFRLVDEYSNFYLRFIEPNKLESAGAWEAVRNQQSYVTWRGYAFENLGLRHLFEIKAALGIAGVATTASTFTHRGDEHTSGLQIDLLIQRADRAINLCEFKFYNAPLRLNKQQLIRLRQRRDDFRQFTRTDHTLFTTLITPYGLVKQPGLGGVVNQSITLDHLFGDRHFTP